MKKNIFLFYFLFSSLSLTAKKVPEFKFTPNSIYLYGIESKDSLLVAYGSLGTIYFSSDYGNDWDRKQLNEFGKYIKCIFYNDNIVLLNELGFISILNKKFELINTIQLTNDKVIAIVSSADGYCLRTNNSLLLFNHNFEKVREVALNSERYINYINELFSKQLKRFSLVTYNSFHINSMVLFNGLYYLYSDSNIVSRYDANLKYIDEFKVWESYCDSCSLWNQMHIVNDEMFLNYENKFVKTKNFNQFIDAKINDQIFFAKSVNNRFIFMNYKDYLKKIFELRGDKTNEIVDFKQHDFFVAYSEMEEISDLTISGNNLFYTISNGKQIYKLDLENSNKQKTQIISDNRSIETDESNNFIHIADFDNLEGNGKIIKYNDSLLCILSKKTFSDTNVDNKIEFNETINSQKFSNWVYFSKDSLINLIPKYKESELSEIFKDYLYLYILTQNVDKNKNIHRLKCDNENNLYLMTLSDSLSEINEVKLNIKISDFTNRLSNLFVKENICFVENYTVKSNQIPQRARILFLDSNYQKINEMKRENKYIDYIYSKNKDEFIFYEFDYSDSIKHVLHTLDNFKTVDTLYSFTKEDKIIYKDYYEFNHHDTDYVAFFNYRHVYFSQVNQRIIGEMYVLNTQTNEFKLRFTFSDSLDIFYDFEKRNHALADYDNDTLYLSAKGNIYTYYLNRPNRAVFNYAKLPDNGRFRFNFQKIGNRFYGLYSDTLRIHNNYWLDISFKEVEDPKPIIQADDYDFGKFDIKETEYKKSKIKVENLSKEADLTVFTFGISDTLNFKTNINEVIQTQPYVIFKGQSVEIDVEFTPKEIGIKECKIQFVVNALTQDEYTILKGEAIDTIKTSVENNIEEVAYLYTMPPFPNPTVSEVTAKFYWDSRIDIDNSEIGVFDLNGNKVSGKENLTFDKLNEWSGNIKWNCVGQSKGTYLIKIQHGNNTKTVKVVVN
jgi:hypothetical protein